MFPRNSLRSQAMDSPCSRSLQTCFLTWPGTNKTLFQALSRRQETILWHSAQISTSSGLLSPLLHLLWRLESEWTTVSKTWLEKFTTQLLPTSNALHTTSMSTLLSTRILNLPLIQFLATPSIWASSRQLSGKLNHLAICMWEESKAETTLAGISGSLKIQTWRFSTWLNPKRLMLEASTLIWQLAIIWRVLSLKPSQRDTLVCISVPSEDTIFNINWMLLIDII